MPIGYWIRLVVLFFNPAASPSRLAKLLKEYSLDPLELSEARPGQGGEAQDVFVIGESAGDTTMWSELRFAFSEHILQHGLQIKPELACKCGIFFFSSSVPWKTLSFKQGSNVNGIHGFACNVQYAHGVSCITLESRKHISRIYRVLGRYLLDGSPVKPRTHA